MKFRHITVNTMPVRVIVDHLLCKEPQASEDDDMMSEFIEQ